MNTTEYLAEIGRLALSTAIAASPRARQCSQRLAGRSIAIDTLDMRFVLNFEPGAVVVSAGDPDADPQADVTVRGSPAALAEALARGSAPDATGSTAVFGDIAVFDDFRDSFRPHLDLGRAGFLAEDLGDALRLGAKAAESAIEGLMNAVQRGGGRRP
ncbi:MAG: hypothetical protein F4X98_18735 [Gammaproteobacteria bacterium]|nr:hypothetical protein [Gammaproteobacteria bacterium]